MFYTENISNKNTKYVIKSDLLSGLEHFFTTRDVCLCGDGDNVGQNKIEVSAFLGVNEDALICPNQTHSDNVAVFEPSQKSYPQTDALIIKDYDAAIFLNFADCVPVIFWDANKNIAAIAHAGWRGTAQKIAAKTVLKMCKDFSCQPNDIRAVIGPAIGDCCYSVGSDVYLTLQSTVSSFEDCFKITEGKIYINLKKINYRQLIDIGVEKIDICNYCTSCDNELFFSYRKENGTSNRHSAVVKLIKGSSR